MKDKISIIVPAYNSEKYIEKCLESLINQTYKNIEILIIDNNSTDNTANICNKYVMKNKNIKYLFCETKGASAARNYGIKNSSGEFICFIDADDYIEINYCECLFNAIKKNNADVCICGIRRIKENGCILQECCIKDFSRIKADDFEEKLLLLYDNLLLNSPTNKLYRKSKITELFDNDYQIGEDLLFNLEYLRQPDIYICGIKEILYNYIIFEKLSFLKLKYYSKNRLSSTINLYNEMIKFGKKYNYSYIFFERVNCIYANKILFCYKEWSFISETFKKRKQRVSKLVHDDCIKNFSINNFKELSKKIIFILIKTKNIFILTMILVFLGEKYNENNK